MNSLLLENGVTRAESRVRIGSGARDLKMVEVTLVEAHETKSCKRFWWYSGILLRVIVKPGSEMESLKERVKFLYLSFLEL